MKIRLMYTAATIVNVSLFVASMVFLVLIITEDNSTTTTTTTTTNSINNNVICNSTTTTVTVYNNTCNSTCTEPVIPLTEQSFDDRLVYDLKTKQYKLYRRNNKDLVLTGSLGLSTETSRLKNVTIQTSNQELRLNFIYHYANLSLTVKDNSKALNPNVTCDTYHWSVDSSLIDFKQTFEDCFILTGSYWYGGAESYSQQFWPINNQTYDPYKPYLTGLFGTSSAVMERYWLSSDGVAVIVDQSIPLFVSMNKTNICFLASSQEPYSRTDIINLKYDVCTIDKSPSDQTYLNNLQLYVIEKYFKKPSGIPDERMFQKPIWSTWAVYKKEINETIVLDFADEISSYGYSNSQLEIDDKWQTVYGDFNFDKNKFPNMSGLIKRLNEKGYRTTLWMHPFANVDSFNFIDKAFQFFWVRGFDGLYPAFTSWWDGLAAVILDTTNPDATDWFVSELENIRNSTGIDSFKFDAGEVEWLPKYFWLNNQTISPDEYSMKYAHMAARLGRMIEVRTGCQTQELPIFVRMLDKDSKWGFDNGLKSVITTGLLMGILGYPFILPDMIGGNAYLVLDNNDTDSFQANISATVYPDYDLFIRWAQLTAFLPSMQFSIPPWHYNVTGVDVNRICREMVELHESVVTPVILKLANNSVETGEPIIRPMWWIDNSDEMNLIIDDQFLVGDKYLVAPIVEQDAYQRDVYLPIGEWIDGNSQTAVYTGPMWYRNYSAPIEVIPYFINKNSIY